jgi:pseudouridine synthase
MARKRVPKWLQAARQGVVPGEGTWLARALGKAGVVPGGEVERAIYSGRVSVNGVVVKEPAHPVADGDAVTFDGKAVYLKAATIVLMFHKPAGCIVADTDPEGAKTVFDLLRDVLPEDLGCFRWHPVGRLDRDTTGLLLFTNDEAIVQRVTSPESKLPKRYVARVEGKPDEAKMELLRKGITLEDGPVRPAGAAILAPGMVEVVLTEGRHHQVRRMLNAIGLAVKGLHREAIGTVQLNVAEGHFRPLARDEIRHGLVAN